MTKASAARIERRRSCSCPATCEADPLPAILPGETVEVQVTFLANGDTVQHLLREDGSRIRLNPTNFRVTP